MIKTILEGFENRCKILNVILQKERSDLKDFLNKTLINFGEKFEKRFTTVEENIYKNITISSEVVQHE